MGAMSDVMETATAKERGLIEYLAASIKTTQAETLRALKENEAKIVALEARIRRLESVGAGRYRMISAWLETIEARLDLREIEGGEAPAAFTPPEPKAPAAEPEKPGEIEIPDPIFKKLTAAGIRTEAEARALSETELANNICLTMNETQELLRLFKAKPAGPGGQAGERS